ncbi:Putative F-box protein [Striga hermonthica]|uniref:F-box protein n=1 Tax=Striga hermonthica TaxID=68872 RepID=A0A9N7ML86_STRHE|nr:Putative F-box protein [Striga hermonthica]
MTSLAQSAIPIPSPDPKRFCCSFGGKPSNLILNSNLIPSSDPKRSKFTDRKKVKFELRSKKMELSSLNKCVEIYNHGDDFISVLPDDILLVILSSLPLKESGRTSVLSSRWRYLWSYTSYLYFDDHSTMEKIAQDPDCCTLKKEREKYVLSMLNFPVMPKLRKLVFIKGLIGVDSSLLDLAHFINASPNLQEFELKQNLLKAERSNREIQKGVKQFPLHQHLNVFQFLGYYGCPSDVELVNYLLENCVALKEIIVDTQPRDPIAYEPVDHKEIKLAEEAKIYAKQQLEPLQQWFDVERSNREIQKGVKQFPLHQHLNVFRFLGYYGCPSDVELVNYLLENCVALKEIIVDTQSLCRPAYEPVDPEELKLTEIAKSYAKQQLEPLVPKHIKLFIC